MADATHNDSPRRNTRIFKPVFLDDDHPLDPSFAWGPVSRNPSLKKSLHDDHVGLIREEIREAVRRSHVTMKDLQSAFGYSTSSNNYTGVNKRLDHPDTMTSNQVLAFCEVTGWSVEQLRCAGDYARDREAILSLFDNLGREKRLKAISYVRRLLELEIMEDELELKETIAQQALDKEPDEVS